MAQDSTKADFWETRYRDGVTPWDAGKVPPEVLPFVHSLAEGARVLVPGCGTAYEVYLMAEQGLDVLAIDFSPAAVQAAQRHLGYFADRVREADFFAFDFGAPYAVVYERAFLCALPPRLWPDYARRMAQLIAPEGQLAGYFFLAEHPKGPPFGISQSQLEQLLSADFECIADRPALESLPVFQGRERWQQWRRR